MCPACLTSLGFIAAGTGFSGGLAIVVARSVRRMAAVKDRTGMEPTETSGNDGGSPLTPRLTTPLSHRVVSSQ